MLFREFPGSPGFRTWHFHSHGLGSIPVPGTKIPQVTWNGQIHTHTHTHTHTHIKYCLLLLLLLSHFSRVWLCVTPWTPDSSVHGIFQAKNGVGCHCPLWNIVYSDSKKKYLGISVTRHVLEFYAKSYKMLIRESKGDINNWRDILCPWMGRLNN